MKAQVAYSLIIMAVLLTAVSLPSIGNMLPNSSIIPAAEAWVQFSNCKWGTTVLWKNINMTSAHLDSTKDVIAHWNDAGANIFMDQTTSTGKINYHTVSRSDVTWLGLSTQATCTSGTYTGTSNNYLNTYNIGSDEERIAWTSAHETGHSLGFDHTEVQSDGGRAVMWAAVNEVITPTLDDIRGLKTKYGAVTSNSQCTEWKTNGDVIHTGTCSGSNPALPVTVKVTSASSTSKGFATTTSSATSLPSNGALVMTAKVKANTVGKFIMGAFTSTDIANSLNRIAAIEMSTDGWYLTRSSSSGYLRTQISSTAPTAGQVYFLELVIRNDKTTAAYIFRDDGGADDPPSWVGSQVLTNVQLPWTSSVYYGTGAYTTATGQPLSDYTISEFHNRLLSYT